MDTTQEQQPQQQQHHQEHQEQSSLSCVEQWVDIKGLLDEVSQELKLGDLVFGENFQLVDAMCCLQVMHPKMDSGMTQEEKVTMEGLVASGALPSDDKLTLQEIIAVFDQILCCEMTYYQGQPVPQTLFTCLYLHRPLTLLNHVVVRAFAVITLKTSLLVRRAVQKADVFEEEDFVVQLFDFGLCEELLDAEALRLIRDAEEKLSVDLAAASEEEKPLYEAIMARMKFRKQLYMAHIYLDKFTEKNFELAKKCLTNAQSEFTMLKSTASLGELPPGVFDSRVTRHIMSSSPPRTTAIISQEKTFQCFDEQLRHLVFICNFPQVEPTFNAINEFYTEFSYLIPDVVARSKLHAHFLQNKKIMGVTTNLDFAVDAMKKMGIPAHFFDKLETKESVRNFAERTGTVLCIHLRNLLNNRSRLRRKISHILDDFTVLQGEGDELDDERNRSDNAREPTRAFGIYVLEMKLRLMAFWLNLGFELEVYPKEEYYMIYWYLDYILAVNVSNQRSLLDLNKNETVDKNKIAKNKKSLQQQQQQYSKQTQVFMTSFFIPHYMLAANMYLAKGMLKLLGALRRLGHVEAKEFPYGDPEVRFLKRFSVFHRMQYQPQPLFYHHFSDVFNTEFENTPVDKMLQGAVDNLQSSKTYLEKILHNQQPAPNATVTTEVKSLLRVAISNTLQCQMLLKNLYSVESSNNTKPTTTFQFSTHHYYPVVTIAK